MTKKKIMLRKKIETKNRMGAWVVWSNTDLTEGLGEEYPSAVCLRETTANRLSKGRYVQGTDCRISPCEIYYIGDTWYGPTTFIQPTSEDHAEEARIANAKLAAFKKQAAIEKAKALGMSNEDLEALKS